MGPFKNLTVAHTYIAKVTGGSQEQRVICGEDISNAERWVTVDTKPGAPEAHVVVQAETVNNTVAFVTRLIQEGGTWRIQYVHYATVKMADKSARDLEIMAEAQQQKRHDFNSYVLYAAALQLADRGPYFQLGIRPEIEKAIAESKKSDLLQGQPPFTWEFGKSNFKILNVGPVAVAGKIYLIIDHEIEPWKEDKEADQQNRTLIEEFAKATPEYKDAFAGLVVRAHERGSRRIFGTVDENPK
jgi:hypothetical protein